MPWFLAISLFSGLVWVYFPQLTKLLSSKLDGNTFRWSARLLQWVPLLFVGTLFLDRLYDSLYVHRQRNEVAQFITPDATWIERFQVALNGQGSVEVGVILFLFLALLSHHLPSIRSADERILKDVRFRMMRHAGLWMLIFALILFPDRMYLPMVDNPQTPISSTLPSWTNVLLGLYFGFCLSLAGELWVVYSMNIDDEHINRLKRNARLKGFLFTALNIWIISHVDIQDIIDNPQVFYRESFVLFVSVYLFMCTSFVSEWGVLDRNGHQEYQTFQLMLPVIIVVCSTLVLSLFTFQYGNHDTSTIQNFSRTINVFAWIILAAVCCMGLPPLGFDKARHPELWWFRFCFVVSPPIVYALNIDVLWLLSLFVSLGFLSLQGQSLAIQKHRTTTRGVPIMIALISMTLLISAVAVSLELTYSLTIWFFFAIFHLRFNRILV